MVVLILSIVILGFGIKFISDLFSKAKDMSQWQEQDFDRQISSLICEGSEKVCVSPQRRTISRKDYHVFGVKIINILEPLSGQPKTNFLIEVETPAGPPTNLLGYKKNNQPIVKNDPVGFNGLIVSPTNPSGVPARDTALAKYEEENLGFGVQVPANAPSGTYILNFIVKANGIVYGQQKIYVEVP